MPVAVLVVESEVFVVDDEVTVVVVSVVMESVVPVTDDVVVFEMVVSVDMVVVVKDVREVVVLVVVSVEAVVELVLVKVVQKLHCLSHMPERVWLHVGQKMLSQASTHRVDWQVELQTASSIRLTEKHGVADEAVVVDVGVTDVETEIVDAVVVDAVVVMVPVVPEVVVEEPVVREDVAEVVVFSAHMPQNVSQVCCEAQVGHRVLSHAFGSMMRKSAQLGTQSSYLKQVVVLRLVVDVPESVVWVCVDVVSVVVTVDRVVVETLVVVSVSEVMVVDVFEVVVRVPDMLVTVLVVLETVDTDDVVVNVSVVQKPQCESHMPANAPSQPGQKMVSH